MRLVTVAGPPSSGKTSVAYKVIECLKQQNARIGVVKYDCLSTFDDEIYRKLDVAIKVGISGNLCPDHFYISNIQDCVRWGQANAFDYLFSESAGLCNRCSPHIKGVLAVCVIDNLSGVNTPKKIGPMLLYADIVVITKGDIVSQAEREVFAYRVRKANSRAKILFVNGLTGQGAFELAGCIQEAATVGDLEGERIRFTMPAAICSYCLGEIRIGEDYQHGSVKKMNLM